MRKCIICFLFLTSAVLFNACGGSSGENSNNIITLTVNSSAVHTGTTTEQNPSLYVYLPPSYETNTEKRYPVIYFLHGFGDPADEIKQWEPDLDSFFSAYPDQEMIVVSVGGLNSLGGSFYVDSPVCGSWETYVTTEAVSLIDSTFRTIAEKGSRGIFGFSMGGFGAINIALKHPDIFCGVYAFAPGLFDENGLRNAFASWASMPDVKRAYGAAFAGGSIPGFTGTASDNRIVAEWENGYGNASGKISAYLSLTQKLSAIRIDYGTSDEFAWIPQGCRYYITSFSDNGISAESVAMNSRHIFGASKVVKYTLPFFKNILVF